ncbi:MAG: prepilin-type N-terminal cleavage/methylation domain-containing protein [Cyanobacteria bacterium P01_F01_bin.56]
MMLSRSSPKDASTAGYTLVEILIVVIIVGILAAIAAPSWLAYATRQRVKAVESDLVEVLKQAQQRAISQRRDITVTIDETAAVPTIVVDGFSEELGPNDLQPGTIALDAPDAPNNVITFDYQGTLRGQEANLPFVVNIVPSTGTAQQQCAIVATILGNVATSSDVALCTTPVL